MHLQTATGDVMALASSALTSRDLYWLLPLVAVVGGLGMWMVRDDSRARRAPLEEQEKRLVEYFEQREIGVRPQTREVNLRRTSLPHERIKAIAAERGYAFDRITQSPKSGHYMHFVLEGRSQ